MIDLELPDGVTEEKYETVLTAVNGVVSVLSPQQRDFAIWYLLLSNATEAARRANYAHPNKAGPRLTQNSKIVAAINEYYFGRDMSAMEVVARLSQQARAEYGDYLIYDDEVGEVVVDLKQLLLDDKGHLIKEVTYVRTGQDSSIQVVKFQDSYQALVQVGRYHSLFKDRQEHEFPDGPPIQFVEVVKPDDAV